MSIEELPFPGIQDRSKLILSSSHSGQPTLYVLDEISGHIQELPKPSPDAHVVAVDPECRTLVFTASDETGTYLWLKGPGQGSFKILVAANQFLRRIRDGKLKRIEYRSLDGEALNGWVILPPGYKEGTRYALITWVYAGQVYSHEAPTFLVKINDLHPLNLQLLAAHGYAVLLPSMPLNPYGEIDDPYLKLMKGVLPAVDRAIEMGIADPKRLALMGQSYGGYSTYGLITQTNRFKAAVSLGGPCDLVSLYGTFDPRLRYEARAHEDPFRMWNSETSWMGAPPWKDMQKYVRNSPLNYAERVQTPLLIVQGDLDYIPIQQGEEFFSALYRQHKRAEFVRYWGEDHVFTSRRNIEDMWKRVFHWFDEFL